MKNQYETPVVEVVSFPKQDVLTASGEVDKKDNENVYALFSSFWDY